MSLRSHVMWIDKSVCQMRQITDPFCVNTMTFAGIFNPLVQNSGAHVGDAV